jgi:hypothetical protein
MSHSFVRVSTTCLVLLIASAGGAHDFPKKAKKLNAELVQNYAACVTPSTTTYAGADACLLSTPVDSVCTFPGSGSGKVTISVQKLTLKTTAKIQGLAPTCEGQTLSVRLGVRTTTDNCPGGHCTVVDQAWTVGSCTVAEGKCAITGSVDTGNPAGAHTAIQVTSCSVGRVGFDSFVCGLLIP